MKIVLLFSKNFHSDPNHVDYSHRNDHQNDGVRNAVEVAALDVEEIEVILA